jgi:hypothetical protein
MLKLNDSEGIRTPAGRAQWISSPSPQPLGHAVLGLDSQAANDRKGTKHKNGYEIKCLMPTHDLGQFTHTCSRHANELRVADLITHYKKNTHCINVLTWSRTWVVAAKTRRPSH